MKWRFMRGRAVIAASTVTLIAAACSGGDARRPITVSGTEVANAAELLEEAEELAPQVAGVEDRCFFVRLGAIEDIAPLLRCGPKGAATKTRVGPWHAIELVLSETEPELTLAIGESFSIGWELLPDERLVRSDGLTPLGSDAANFPPPTAFPRGLHPLVEELPGEFQECMAAGGFVVFRVTLLYDGKSQKLDSDRIVAIGHDSHQTLTWADPGGDEEQAATQTCLESIATANGLDFESDAGDAVPAES